MRLKEAKYYKKVGHRIQCYLCPHNCIIDNDRYGICRVRKNVEGRLISEVYGRLVAKNTDPVEKKPLYHFYPGKKILSVGTAGCNLKCFFCQNCEISQTGVGNIRNSLILKPEDLVKECLYMQDNIGIAFTYNEPTVYFEYMFDTSALAKEQGLKTAMVSNGFISLTPLSDLLSVMDAFNIDLKAFSAQFYKKYTKSEIKNVKETLLKIKNSGKHLEITYLLIPGLNDDLDEFKSMLDWISTHFGKDQVLHISRYFPNYKSDIPPTPLSSLEKFIKVARDNLNYAYLGNTSLPDVQNSYCPDCAHLVIGRNYYSTDVYLDSSGNCPKCGKHIVNHV